MWGLAWGLHRHHRQYFPLLGNRLGGPSPSGVPMPALTIISSQACILASNKAWFRAVNHWPPIATQRKNLFCWTQQGAVRWKENIYIALVVTYQDSTVEGHIVSNCPASLIAIPWTRTWCAIVAWTSSVKFVPGLPRPLPPCPFRKRERLGFANCV